MEEEVKEKGIIVGEKKKGRAGGVGKEGWEDSKIQGQTDRHE